MHFGAPVKKFASDRSGQFAIIFSLCLIPVFAGVGMAVDYTYLVQSKTRLHDATDAAALFAARQYRLTGKLPAKSKVLAFVEADYAKVASENVPSIVDYKIVDGKIHLETKVVTPLNIMGMFGKKNTNTQVASIVNVGADQELEIALALDTTYSMTKASGASSDQLDPTGEFLPPGTTNVDRITALKVAALKFSNAIFGAAGATSTRRISVVPFSRYVNVGVLQRGQSWLDVPADSASTGSTCSDWYYPVVGYSTKCTPVSYLYDGVEVKYNSCEPIYGTEKVQSCWPTGESKWYGCVGSRKEPYNLKEAFSSQKFTGLMNLTCGTELLPLSADKVAVANRISSLSANDYTYIPEGVMWGTRVLTPGAPFVEAHTSTKTKEVKKIMILMTDGENQASAELPDYPTHNGSNYAQADSWTTKACDQAKAQDIEIYSVTFGTDLSAAAKSIIKGCASSPSNYYDASNAEKLVKAFEDIAAQVNRMYLAG
jgi:Flp pilus assembly protein TadG